MSSLSQKITSQNSAVRDLIKSEKQNAARISEELDKEIGKFNDYIRRLGELNPSQAKNPLTFGLTKKISEFQREIENNEDKIKANNAKAVEIDNKKKENDKFFKKFYGEKKVWLDRLSEKKFQDLAYQKEFKYLYEAKTIKLLMEGILLEKVEDEIEKELTVRGQLFGWDVMDEQKFNERRKAEERELNLELLNEKNNDIALSKERDQKVKWAKEDEEAKKKREEIQETWKELWGQIWLPNVPYSGDKTTIHSRDLMKKILMEVTFRMFQKILFDVWKFKNIVNNTDEYVILDKVRKYFPNEGNKTGIRKDEAILDKLMNIIENVRREEEVIYMDLNPAKEYLSKIVKSNENSGVNNASVERIRNLINQIEYIHSKLKADPSALIKREVEDVHDLIRNIPDENEQKLFRENLRDEPRLFDVFLPLTTILMIETFISTGNKRTKNYQNKLDEIKEKNEKIKLETDEMDGKLKTLNEIEQKVKELSSQYQDPEEELKMYIQNQQELVKMTNSVQEVKKLIYKQQQEFLENINETLLKQDEREIM